LVSAVVAGDDLGGDLAELDVAVLGGADQELERPLVVDLVPLHADADRLAGPGGW
jgi:hypothetical protein